MIYLYVYILDQTLTNIYSPGIFWCPVCGLVAGQQDRRDQQHRGTPEVVASGLIRVDFPMEKPMGSIGKP